MEAWCNINFCDIYSNPLCLAHHLFYNGSEIHDLVIPSSITNIGAYSFYYCIGLSSISIGNSVTSIGESAFQACIGVSSLTIGSGVSNIGQGAFASADIPIVISLIENPFEIVNNTFSNNTFINATLYVPKGCIDKYKSTEGWKYFNYIEESSSNGTNETQKCEKPTISYSNGKLIFNSATEGVTFLSSITDTDINSYSTNEVLLGVTYEISVYATKVGYEDSETATATLCWIDVEPKTEGLNSIAQVKANAVMIKADGGLLTIEGAEDNTNISVYTIDGVQVGSTTSRNGIAHVNTNIIRDSIAIVKIGSRSVKVIMK